MQKFSVLTLVMIDSGKGCSLNHFRIYDVHNRVLRLLFIKEARYSPWTRPNNASAMGIANVYPTRSLPSVSSSVFLRLLLTCKILSLFHKAFSSGPLFVPFLLCFLPSQLWQMEIAKRYPPLTPIGTSAPEKFPHTSTPSLSG